MEIDIVKLLTAMWQRVWLIILAAVIGAVLAFVFSHFYMKPTYQSSALLYVNSNKVSVGSTSISLSDLSTSRRLADTYSVIVKTRSTLNEVISRSGLNYTYNAVNNMVSASVVGYTEVLKITVTSNDPQEAALIVNTIAEVLPERVSEIINGASLSVIDYGVVPLAKSGPNTSRNVFIGILLGLVISCGIIIVIEMLDEQIRDEETITQTYDVPILASIPDLSDSGRGKYGYRRYYGKYYKYASSYYGSSSGKKGGNGDGDETADK